jgi:hypothetical protein
LLWSLEAIFDSAKSSSEIICHIGDCCPLSM